MIESVYQERDVDHKSFQIAVDSRHNIIACFGVIRRYLISGLRPFSGCRSLTVSLGCRDGLQFSILAHTVGVT